MAKRVKTREPKFYVGEDKDIPPRQTAMPLLSKKWRAIIPEHVRELLKAKQSLRIDLGCGANKQQGPDIIGLDARNLPGVDIVHDLEEFPWPLPDDSVRVAFASHYFEHVKPWKFLPLMAELHRVMMHDGQVLAAGPYGVEFRFVQDPTHCNPINEATFCYWDRAHPSRLWDVYEPPCFHLEAFDLIPAGSSRDFNAFLRCCKARTPEECKHTTLEEALRSRNGRKTTPKRKKR